MAHSHQGEQQRRRRERIEEQRSGIPEQPHLEGQFAPEAIGDSAEEQVRGRMDRGEEPDNDADRHEVRAHMLRVERDHGHERVRVHRAKHRRGEQVQRPPRGHRRPDAGDAQKDEPTRFP